MENPEWSTAVTQADLKHWVFSRSTSAFGYKDFLAAAYEQQELKLEITIPGWLTIFAHKIGWISLLDVCGCTSLPK